MLIKNYNSPLVLSIVTPSYNQGRFIEETILSVISQKGDFYIDYVIMDGKSQDKSLSIIKKYSRKLFRSKQRKISGVVFYLPDTEDHLIKCKGISLRYYVGEDSGQYDAINKGFSKTVGAICAWINSDDKYFDGAFLRVFKVFSKYKEIKWITSRRPGYLDYTGLYFGNFSLTAASAQMYYDGLLSFGEKKMLTIGCIQQESTFWRRELWDKVGGLSTDFSLAGDFVLWGKFFLRSEVYLVDFPIAMFRNHGKNRSVIQSTEYYKQAETFRVALGKTSYRRFLFITRLYLLPLLNRLVNYPFKQVLVDQNGELYKENCLLKREKKKTWSIG